MTKHFELNLLPGEHVLSMFVRKLWINATRSVADEQRSLVNRMETIGIQSLTNSVLNHMLQNIVDPEEQERVLREHTLCGFYSSSLKLKWIRSYLASIRVKRRFELFVPHCSKLRSNKSWRWCNDCVKEDREKFGVSYWHVEHQLPTSLTCSKHNQKRLISECNECGYIIRDLKEVSGPDINCPNCGDEFEQSQKALTELQQWIQERGFDLHRDTKNLLKPEYSYDMNYAVCLQSSRTRLIGNSSNLERRDEIQNAFSKWALNYGADIFFVDNFSFRKDRAVDIGKTMHYNRKVSPLSHLLWLKFLGVNGFFEVR